MHKKKVQMMRRKILINNPSFKILQDKLESSQVSNQGTSILTHIHMAIQVDNNQAQADQEVLRSYNQDRFPQKC